MKKYLLYLLALMSLVFASIHSYAVPNVQAQGSTVPDSTTVNITKLQAESFPNGTLTNPDGSAKSLEELTTELGSTVTGLDGVTFTYYPIEEATYNDYKNGTIPATAPTSGGTALATTAGGGLTTWNVPTQKDANGNVIPSYFVVYETGQPDTVSSSLAVPFVIAFPMANPDGSGYLSTVNIYPKNVTADTPAVAKAVDTLAGTSGTYNVGQEYSYHLKSTIPTNIATYQSFVITDQLNSALTFNSATVSVNGNVLAAGTDYTIAPTVATPGANVTITFTPKGLTKIDEIADGLTRTAATEIATIATPGAYIDVEIKAMINGTATMGTDISNTFTLAYDNTSNGTADPKTLTSNPVNVNTGGKVFTKIAGTGSKTFLAGAQFTLQSAGKNVAWTPELIAANRVAIDAGKFIVGGKPSTAGATPSGDITLVSAVDGKFEIKGLAYGDYTLIETVPPAGYTNLAEPIPFTVNANSYTTNQDVVNNARPSIPDTGGIGSIIFVILGLCLMFIAYRGYKRYVRE